MGAARYIGRVGALAVGLGVGVAIAGGQSVARADDTGDTTASSPSSAVSPDSSRAGSQSEDTTDDRTEAPEHGSLTPDPDLESLVDTDEVGGEGDTKTSAGPSIADSTDIELDIEDLVETEPPPSAPPPRGARSKTSHSQAAIADNSDPPTEPTHENLRSQPETTSLDAVLSEVPTRAVPSLPAESVPDLTPLGSTVRIETPAESASAPSTTATASVQLLDAGMGPILGGAGPLLPAGPSPTALMEVAAVRRLLDEAVAENDPQSAGALAVTTSSAPAGPQAQAMAVAAADSAGGYDIPDLPTNGSPLQSIAAPDGSLYQVVLITTTDENTGFSSNTTTVRKVSPAGATTEITTLPGSGGWRASLSPPMAAPI